MVVWRGISVKGELPTVSKYLLDRSGLGYIARFMDADIDRGESPPRNEPAQGGDNAQLPEGPRDRSSSLRNQLKEKIAGKVIPFIGPPASGKGTNSKSLARATGAVHISVGALLREEVATGSELGSELDKYISKGRNAPDEFVVPLLQERLRGTDVARGVILDGFPRTESQARAMEEVLDGSALTLLTAVSLEVPDDVCLNRMLKRRAESKKVRDDDNPEVFKDRLSEFRTVTLPLLSIFAEDEKLLEIPADSTLLATQRLLREALVGVPDN